MTVSPTSDDCLFCRIISGPPQERVWHDCPLAMIPDVGGVIAGLGAFVPGYVLVFPHQHVVSTKLIPAQHLSIFRTLMRRVVHSVSNIYGPVTIFEHGSCARPDIRRSACLSHAHVHILPGSYALTSYIAATSDRFEQTGSGYLFLEEPLANPRFSLDPGVSQFFRRCIATQLGVADQWDYLMFPRLENVLTTIQRLQGRLL